MKKFFKVFADLFTKNRITMSSAALSYYLTMTFFPVVICIYTLLGRSLDTTETVLNFIQSVMPIETVDYLRRFLTYVSENYSFLMMLLALSVVLLSASAAIRSMENTIGRMQGGMRYEGYAYFVISFVLSIVFVLVIYLVILFMFLSKNVLSYINRFIPYFELSTSWLYIRFIFLAGCAFVIIWLIYNLCMRKDDHYKTLLGSLIATVLLTVVSYCFSKFLSAAIKYPLVYGSLASLVLLMFWLYCISLSIFVGATVNVAVRDCKLSNNASEEP